MIKPILVHQADGIHTQAVTHQTLAFTILGLDWLTYHNPTIDWETQSLTFDGYICKHPIVLHQIRNRIGITDPKVMVATPQMSPEDQSRISKDWLKSEFPQVFDMELHSELPPYRAGYDFDPQFKKDVPLPKKPGINIWENTPTYISYCSKPLLCTETGFNYRTTLLDYRGLNSVTVNDRYPTASVRSLIQQLAGGYYYAKLDLRKGYNSIRVKEGSEWKLAFKCHMGLFEPLVMPFGPKTAPAWFQRFISDHCQVFMEEGWLVNMLDDFVIKTVGTLEEHKEHIARLLGKLTELK
ncbi:hypothetical protein SeLEV6574_g00715 [Synchytrium endobioticum]|uniref:Reverse transcriptase domain-containing protein n=1 Tax=Synchytrium endobioticum TaxID=286115 RepID=A0A507DGV7_9FUNG|nr:hypothetical protein SeLEV6574_g00715 [Synchytrium endobioticum]